MQQIAIEVLERRAQGGTWWFDCQTRELWWSNGVYDLHGVEAENFTPTFEAALDFYVPESRQRLEAAINHAIEDDTGWNLALELVRANGSHRHVRAIGQVDQRPGQAPLLAGAIIDAHEQTVEDRSRHTNAQRMARENARWRVAGETLGVSLMEIDLDAVTCHISGDLAQRMGLSADAEAGISCGQWLAFVHEEDRDRRQRCLDAHLAGETPSYTCEYRLNLPETGAIRVKETGRQMRAADEADGVRLIAALEDISTDKPDEIARRDSRKALELTFRHAPIGMALVSTQGRWLAVNRSLCQMVGYTESELLALTFQDITHPDDLDGDLAYVNSMLAGRRRTYRMEKRYFHKQGHIVDIQLDVSLLRDEAGDPVHFISHIQDISERKREHDALFAANELAEVTFEAIGEGVIRVDEQGKIVGVNSAAVSLLAARSDSLIGQPFGAVITLYDPHREHPLADPVAHVLESGERVRVPIFTRLRRQDGRYIAIVDSASPIHDERGQVRGAVFVFQDISEARRMTDELLHQANHDALTGLPNRRGFEEGLERAWQRVRAGFGGIYVMYLDLDHFKTINDTCGHSAGDEMLRQIALNFRSILRDSDLLARLGGDEFAAIVSAKNERGAQTVAEKFIRAVGDLRFTYGGRSYGVGLSVGIAALDAGVASTEEALVHADAALYVAKDSGRGRAYLYHSEDGAHAPAADYVNTAELLQGGLEQNRFVLYLQEIVDIDGHRLGYEALLRFQGPDGVVNPDTFLPTAKRLGMTTRIDRWVVAEALAMIRDFVQRDLWPPDCYLAINLSPVSLADPQFHAELMALLDQHQIRAGRLVFEITESAELFGDEYPRLIENLRKRGFEVWLDDFASGYNGFDMLKRVAVDGIKIERSFVQDIERDPIDRAVIRSIGDVSEALSLGVIAEGVETKAVLELLVKAGFKRFQGLLFHDPEPADAALARRRGESMAG